MTVSRKGANCEGALIKGAPFVFLTPESSREARATLISDKSLSSLFKLDPRLVPPAQSPRKIEYVRQNVPEVLPKQVTIQACKRITRDP
jgi:hypothetical protein